jgi:hypothetical protein
MRGKRERERETFPVPHAGNGSKDSSRNHFNSIQVSVYLDKNLLKIMRNSHKNLRSSNTK